MMVSKNISAMLKKDKPAKCNDLDMFTLPCVIGDKKVEQAMLDSGASISIMPYSVYLELKLNDMQDISVVIQLADKFVVHPLGVKGTF